MSAFVASALRGERPDFLGFGAVEDDNHFVRVAAAQGVDCLLRRNFMNSGAWPRLSASLRTGLDRRAHHESVLEMARQRELTQLLAVLSDAKIRVLVLKGAALAYTHYPEPHLRPCSDLDLLIHRSSLEKTTVELENLGYRRRNSISREAVHSQWTFDRNCVSFKHVVDLHWRISNRPLFGDMLSFEALVPTAVPVKQLGDSARTLSPVDALLFACIHRVAHHNGSHLLIWLYDIKLLAEALSPAEWVFFWQAAVRKRLVGVCEESFAAMASLVGGCSEPVERVLGDRTAAKLSRSNEPSAAYLGVVGTQWRSFRLDLVAARGPVAKLRFLGSHAFPARAYMRDAYGATNHLALARAYVRRATSGAWRAIISQLSSGGITH